MENIYQRLTPIFRDIFEDDEVVANPAMTAADVPGWDSLSHVRLMLEVQRAFQIKFSAAQISNMKNVGELAALIERKTAGAA